MARLLKIPRSYFTISQSLGLSNQINTQKQNSCFYRLASTDTSKIAELPSVVITDDGSTIACWHPEKDFPYECSKPVPRFEPELNETDSVLKVQHRLLHKHRFNIRGPSRFDLQRLTFTTKHVWYPNNKIKYKKPPITPDRETL